MPREHNYSVNVIWTGNTGTGTSDYQAYKRDHEIEAAWETDRFWVRPIRNSGEILLDTIRKSC